MLKMLKNLKVAQKLILGFGIVIALSLVMAVVSVMGIKDLATGQDDVFEVSEFSTLMTDLREQEKNYMLHGDLKLGNAIQTPREKMFDLFMQIEAKIAGIKEITSDTFILSTIDNLEDNFTAYRTAFNVYVTYEQSKQAAEENMAAAAEEVTSIILTMQETQQEKLTEELWENGNTQKLLAQISLGNSANDIVRLMYQLRNDEKTFALTNDPAYIDAANAKIDEIFALLEGIQGRSTGSELNEHAEAIQTNLLMYEENFSNYVDAVHKQMQEEKVLLEEAVAVSESSDQLVELYMEQLDQTTNNAKNTAIIVLVLVVLVSGAVAYLNLTAILSPIRDIKQAAEKIADGDIQVAIKTDQKDEFGDLANAFRAMIAYITEVAYNLELLSMGHLTGEITPKSERDVLGLALEKLIKNLRQQISNVSANAGLLNDASQEIHNAAEQAGSATQQITLTIQQVAQGTSQQAASVTNTAQSMEQLTRAIEGVAQGAQEQSTGVMKASQVTGSLMENIQKVTDNADSVAKDSKLAAETAQKGTMTVEETLAVMQRIKDKVNASSEKVHDMGERSSEIGVILETIRDIASQTNLLALNAAIEAARAGEHGKGFAVVADEVRKLAERSASATKEIEDLIKNIQLSVKDAVSAMKEGTTEVETGVQKANLAGSALNEIQDASESVLKQAALVQDATNEMRAAADELVNAVDSVSAIVEENSASTEQMSANSSEVSLAFESIASISEENSASIEEVSASTEEMSAQVQEVTAATGQLADMAQTLAEVVAQFTLPEDYENLIQDEAETATVEDEFNETVQESVENPGIETVAKNQEKTRFFKKQWHWLKAKFRSK